MGRCRARRPFVPGELHAKTVEGYFSIFKRGMKAALQSSERAAAILKGTEGKHLTYRRPYQA
jgi:hypothetical protein